MKALVPGGRVRGLSLIELMIAMLIGTLLMVGIIQVFGSSREAYRLSEGLARVQENSRFAVDYLQRDIRMAGHFGCVNDQAMMRQNPVALTTTFGAAAHPALDFGISIQGYEAADTGPGAADVSLTAGDVDFSPALPDEYADQMDDAVAGSDVIVLRFLDPNGVPMTAAPADPANPVFQFDSARWSVLQSGVDNPGLFGAADCTGAVVFQASAVNSGAGTISVTGAPNNAEAIAKVFTAGQTTLYRAESAVYYVGTNAAGGRSLYRLRFAYAPNAAAPTVRKEEMVDGVENMQLLYGQDRELDPGKSPTGYIDRQYTADEIESTRAGAATVADAWRRVGAVQIGLVMSSPERASSVQASDEHRLNALGVTFAAPEDRRFRSVYQTTIALRNRLYGN
ncbi:PilW family protein [Stenotrophomonas sp. LARHCG68]